TTPPGRPKMVLTPSRRSDSQKISAPVNFIPAPSEPLPSGDAAQGFPSCDPCPPVSVSESASSRLPHPASGNVCVEIRRVFFPARGALHKTFLALDPYPRGRQSRVRP